MTKLTNLASLGSGAIADGDHVYVVDTSDTTGSSAGTSKSATMAVLASYMEGAIDLIEDSLTIERTGARPALVLNRTDTSSGQQGSVQFQEGGSDLAEIQLREVGGTSQLRIRNIEADTELHLNQNGGLEFYTDFSASTSYHVALSDGTTGGSGSAGSGNQYVELNINGTTYKMLHDGTV